MTQTEFAQKVKDYGIPLRSLGFQVEDIKERPLLKKIFQKKNLNKKNLFAYIRQDGSEWKIYRMDGQRKELWFAGNEEEAFQKFYELVFDQIRDKGYLNDCITREIVETNANEVRKFVKQYFHLYDDKTPNEYCIVALIQMERALYTFFKDIAAFDEFKYYVKTGKFVPADTCIERKGWTAESIHEKTKFNEIYAFWVLAMLETHPVHGQFLLRMNRKRKRKVQKLSMI
jgi:hypothetical protein